MADAGPIFVTIVSVALWCLLAGWLLDALGLRSRYIRNLERPNLSIASYRPATTLKPRTNFILGAIMISIGATFFSIITLLALADRLK